MEFLPLFLRLRDRPVLVVGGGAVAARKVRLLVDAGARVRVVAPRLAPPLTELLAAGRVEHVPARFAAGQLQGAMLVIAATDDAAVNGAVSQAAAARGIWCNVVDDAQQSAAIFPAIVDRSPLMVAIASGGAAPVLVTRVRARVEALLEPSLGRLAKFAHEIRDRVRWRIAAGAARRAFWHALFDGPIAVALRNGRDAQAWRLLRSALSSRSPARPRGRVLLVGAGPGDPGLLTLRALRALQEADVVLHDRLVSADVLALGRRDAEYIAVGKHHGDADAVQARILDLLRTHALAGKVVVRLKGGDPLVFARAQEELQALHDAGIDVEIVPGITAALACAAYAGIPLTARGGSDGLRLVTAAHCSGEHAPDWASLARTRDTLVFYMGVAGLARIAAGLIEHGRAPGTPAALVEQGSTPAQRVLLATLATIARDAADHAIQSPAVLIVGEQAAQARVFRWFGGEFIDAARIPALPAAA